MAAGSNESIWTGSLPSDGDPSAEILALHEALDQLAALEPAVAKVVKLRYFAGLTGRGGRAGTGHVAPHSQPHWAYARAWLYQRLKPDDNASV